MRAAICRPRSFSSRDPRTLNRHSRTRHQIFLGPFPLLFSPSAAQKRSAGALPVLSRVSTTSRPVKSRSAACLFDFHITPIFSNISSSHRRHCSAEETWQTVQVSPPICPLSLSPRLCATQQISGRVQTLTGALSAEIARFSPLFPSNSSTPQLGTSQPPKVRVNCMRIHS